MSYLTKLSVSLLAPIAAALLCLLPPSAEALDRSDLLFYAPFDGTLDAFATNAVIRPGGDPQVQFARESPGKASSPRGTLATSSVNCSAARAR